MLSASPCVMVELSREAFHCIGNAYSLAAVELKTHFKDGARICNAIDALLDVWRLTRATGRTDAYSRNIASESNPSQTSIRTPRISLPEANAGPWGFHVSIVLCLRAHLFLLTTFIAVAFALNVREQRFKRRWKRGVTVAGNSSVARE